MLPPSAGWFPKEAFTHHLGFEARSENRERALETGQPLGRIVLFFLKIATGRKGKGFSKEDWREEINRIPARPPIEDRRQEPIPPLDLSVPNDYQSLSDDKKRQELYRDDNMAKVTKTFDDLARTDLAKEGIVGDPSPCAFHISEDLSTGWGVVRIRRGVAHDSPEGLLGRAIKAGIILSGINYWNPEERIYRLNLRTGEYSLLERSIGTTHELQYRMRDFIQEDPHISSEATTALRARAVHFPTDRSMGRLFVRDRGADDWYQGWKELGEARGDVSIPKDTEVKLEVSRDAARDLSPLADLRANDLQMLSFGWEDGQISSLAPLEQLKGLKALNLQRAKFDSEDFRYLTGMAGLEVLRLGDHQLADESMRHIGRLSSLRSLALWGTGISDDGLKHLRGLTNLRFLALNTCDITDNGLRYLRKMTALEGLQIYQTRITDEGLDQLRGLKKLKHIKIGGNNITDDGLKRLEGLTLLENIWLENNPITDAGLAYLSGMENLQELYAGFTYITDAGMAHLKGLENLWHLWVSGIGDKGIDHLSEAPALEYLAIGDAKVTEASIPSFKRMKSLGRLSLSGDRITDDLRAALRAALHGCKVWDPEEGPDYPASPWKRRFQKVYRLEEGQVLRRIAPPFIPERGEYYRHEESFQASLIRRPPDRFIFHWNGKLKSWGYGFTDDLSLKSVLHHALNLESSEYDGPKEILSLDLLGDWIVRHEAPIEEKLQALEQIVADDLGQSIRFELRGVERDVIVARGEYEFHPEPNAYNDTSVHIFADILDPNEGAGGGTGDLIKFLRWVGNRVGMPFINETRTPDEVRLNWGNHRSSKLQDVPEPERSTKLDMVLTNLGKQTSLTFTKERRKVGVWFVSEKGQGSDNRPTSQGV